MSEGLKKLGKIETVYYRSSISFHSRFKVDAISGIHDFEGAMDTYEGCAKISRTPHFEVLSRRLDRLREGGVRGIFITPLIRIREPISDGHKWYTPKIRRSL